MLHLFWKIKCFLQSLFSHKTLGARALVIQGDKILLVKHTYAPGWCTIGGGIEARESGLQALVRELKEEVGVTPTKIPSLLGFYHHPSRKQDDYVAVYVCKDFHKEDAASREILEAKWFSLTALPSDTTPATKGCIEEYLGRQPLRDRW